MARLDATALDQMIGAYVWTRTRTVNGRRVIAIDGKTVRGARTATTTTPHLVSALDHATGTVLGPLATAAKSNEIPTVRTLLAGFDLTGVVVTMDAMHTQTDTATAIVEAGGDYVFTVKANQPNLYAACKKLPWREVTEHSRVSTGHGRRVRRTIKVVPPRPGSPSPAQPRSRRSAAPPPGPGRRPSRSSTSSPPQTTAPPHRRSWPPGSKDTGASRTAATGSATSPSTRTAPASAPPTHPT